MIRRLLLASALLALAPAARPQTRVPAINNETPSIWFVELSGPPLADGGNATALAAEKAAFRAAARTARLSVRERFAFDRLWNGVSVTVAPADVVRVSRLPGVKAVYPVLSANLPPVEKDLAFAVTMTGADVVGSELGLTGKGVRVAVMDTGLDLEHPDFLDGPVSRVVAGWDFVGDAFNADPASPAFNPVPAPDETPDDCNGHGTHVAGIVGANGVVKGVAPEVDFGIYRVFGCQGSTTSDVMIAAMERALADGMQVLNMSIGAAFQTWPQYPTAAAADRLAGLGVVVVASIGNSGANGLWSAGAPGVGRDVIGVASIDNVQETFWTFTVSPDATAIGYAPATAAPLAPREGEFPLARTGTTTTLDDGCAPRPTGSLAGQVVLVRRGTCTFFQKALNAQQAGAAGVVLYNNQPGRVNPTVAGAVAITIPVVAITAADGALLDGRIAAGPTTLTWTNVTAAFPSATGGLVSSFSSYGLDAELTIKPDLAAPGGSIWSAVPLELGGWGTNSGTSMAAPHVAGAAALYLQAWPQAQVRRVREALQATASPVLWFGDPGLGFEDVVHRQGAGLLQIDEAILSTTRIVPSKISLGEGSGAKGIHVVLENRSPVPVTYAVGHEPALATGPGTFAPSFFDAFATVSISTTRLTLKPGGTASVRVTITAPAALADRSLYGGWITFTPPQAGAKALRVPYSGFKGDYQSIVALAPTAAGFPWIARADGATFLKQDAGAVFTLAGPDQLPTLVFHLDHPVAALTVDLRGPGGKLVDRLAADRFVGRNATATGFFTLVWDGTFQAGGKVAPAPNGQYQLIVTVRKALGSDRELETWTSPAFVIQR